MFWSLLPVEHWLLTLYIYIYPKFSYFEFVFETPKLGVLFGETVSESNEDYNVKHLANTPCLYNSNKPQDTFGFLILHRFTVTSCRDSEKAWVNQRFEHPQFGDTSKFGNMSGPKNLQAAHDFGTIW